MTRYKVTGSLPVVVTVEAVDPDDAVVVAEDLTSESWLPNGEVETDGAVEEAGE